MLNDRFRYLAALGFIAALCVVSPGCGSNPEPALGGQRHVAAFGQRINPAALQTLSQVKSPTSGSNLECNPTSNFGYWNTIYVGGGGEAFVDGPSKGGLDTQCLLQKGFGFSIPAGATVTSISVSFNAYLTVQSGTKAPVEWCAQVTVLGEINNGGGLCTAYETNTSPKAFTIEAPISNWGGGGDFDPANINANFELCFQGLPQPIQGKQYQEDLYITDPKVTIYYTD